MAKDDLTKNHQLDSNTVEGRLYEIKDDDERCPVKCFVKYKNMLPSGVPYLFPKVRKIRNKQGYFFDHPPLGHNKIGKMMIVLSEKANLSRRYTDHSLRATSVHILHCAHVPSRHIMSVTGHKSEQSLKTYTSFTDGNTKKHMSHTLSRAVGLHVEEHEQFVTKKMRPNNEVNPVNNVFELQDFENASDRELQLLSDSEVNSLLKDIDFTDGEFENIAMTLNDISNQPVSRIPNSCSSQNLSNTLNYFSRGQPLPMPTLNAQNMTINYNFLN